MLCDYILTMTQSFSLYMCINPRSLFRLFLKLIRRSFWSLPHKYYGTLQPRLFSIHDHCTGALQSWCNLYHMPISIVLHVCLFPRVHHSNGPYVTTVVSPRGATEEQTCLIDEQEVEQRGPFVAFSAVARDSPQENNGFGACCPL